MIPLRTQESGSIHRAVLLWLLAGISVLAIGFIALNIACLRSAQMMSPKNVLATADRLTFRTIDVDPAPPHEWMLGSEFHVNSSDSPEAALLVRQLQAVTNTTTALPPARHVDYEIEVGRYAGVDRMDDALYYDYESTSGKLNLNQNSKESDWYQVSPAFRYHFLKFAAAAKAKEAQSLAKQQQQQRERDAKRAAAEKAQEQAEIERQKRLCGQGPCMIVLHRHGGAP